MKFPNRIREHRKAKGWSIETLAEKVRFSPSFVSRIEKGGRRLSMEHLPRFAEVFGVRPVDLVPEDGEPAMTTVPVLGKISAGGAIETFAEQIEDGGNLYEIQVPFALPSDAFALEVQGESMWPRYDAGDVVIAHHHSSEASTLVGWEAAVRTIEGNRYLKRLEKGSRKGLFHLESHNAAPIKDVRIDWLSDILAVVRANQVRRLTRPAKKKLFQKVMTES